MKLSTNPFMQEFSYQVWKNTYRWESDETVYDTFKRVARAVASVEEDKKYWEDQYYKILSEFKYVPGGRILSNAGTGLKKTTLINCFVAGFSGKNIDSIDSIYKEIHRQAKILSSEGGYGINFSALRPRGSYVSGIGVETSGVIEFMKVWDASSDVLTRGSGKSNSGGKGKGGIRKGAMMSMMFCWHPSIEEFIVAKQSPGVLTRFNMTVLVTDEFMQCVKKHKPWKLEFPETSFDKYDDEWDGNLDVWKSKGYPVKVWKEYSDANELWDLLIHSTYTRNEPGIGFIDRVNKLNNLNYCEVIQASNPCFTGDTIVAVADGRNGISIKQLAEESNGTVKFPVYSGKLKIQRSDQKNSHKVEIKNAVAFKTGTKEIIEVVLSDGSSFKCTPDHLLATADGDWVKAIDSEGVFLETKPKELVRDINDSKISVKKIIIVGKQEDVYDLTVEDNNNFYIITNTDDARYMNCSGILVHNCGEQFLAINGACCLGSINLTQYIKNERIDYESLKLDIPIIVRFQDSINDITNFPLPEQKKEALSKRKVGVGYMGYGSALYMLKIPYGSKKSIKITEEMCSFVTNHLYQASALLAKEKGSFPEFIKDKYLESLFIKQALTEETVALIKKHGIRNSHLTTVAPTGNSSIFANCVSGGLEPVVNAVYTRTVTVPHIPSFIQIPAIIDWDHQKHDDSSEWEWVMEGDEFILRKEFEVDGKMVVFKIDRNRGLCREEMVYDYAVLALGEEFWEDKIKAEKEKIEFYGKTIFDLTVEEHLSIMAIFAKYVDSSISKTINIPNDYVYEDFKKVYETAYDTGFIKGLTTYRVGTMTNVLSVDPSPVSKGIPQRNSPQRPKALPCRVHRIAVKGEKWIVFVGLYEGDPYEVFAGKIDLVDIPSSISDGMIVRQKQGVYSFEYNGEVIVKDINKVFDNAENEAKTRLLSMALRHGTPIKFVVEQLQKSRGFVGDFPKSIVRALKSYIPDGTDTKEKCGNCGEALVFLEGCYSCKSCGWAKCG